MVIYGYCKGPFMAKNERSIYQKEVISRYYENLDTIMLGKLGELVTDLYLAEGKAMVMPMGERSFLRLPSTAMLPTTVRVLGMVRIVSLEAAVVS